MKFTEECVAAVGKTLLPATSAAGSQISDLASRILATFGH